MEDNMDDAPTHNNGGVVDKVLQLVKEQKNFSGAVMYICDFIEDHDTTDKIKILLNSGYCIELPSRSYSIFQGVLEHLKYQPLKEIIYQVLNYSFDWATCIASENIDIGLIAAQIQGGEILTKRYICINDIINFLERDLNKNENNTGRT